MYFLNLMQNLLSVFKMVMKKFIQIIVLFILIISNIARKNVTSDLKLKQVNIVSHFMIFNSRIIFNTIIS